MQFYLIVPLLCWVFSKNKFMFLLALVGSLVSCFVVTGISPKTSFFMLPFRLWEFLIGYGAAYYFTNQGNVKLINYRWLGLIGLIIVFIIPLFSVNGEALSAIDGHPGLFALLVTLATTSILIFGIPSLIEKSFFSRILERIGKYSYSIYLAHFPIIVIYLSKPFSGTNLTIPTLVDGVIIVVLMVLFSAILYYFFEHKRLKVSVTKLIIGASVSLVLLAMILPIIQNKFYSQEERLIFGAFSDRSTYRCGKLIRVLEPRAISCDLTPEIDEPEQRVMLVGNSHSDSIKTSFVKASEANQSKLFFMVSNTPLMEGDISAKGVVDEAISKGVNKIVLHFKEFSIPNETISEVIAQSKLAGIKVYFIEPVPVWKESVPVSMYNDIHQKDTIAEKQTKTDYISRNASQVDFVRAIIDDNFTSLPVVDFFCNPDCQYASDNGKPFYFDDDHLTITGSEQIKDVFDKILLD